MRAHLAVLLGLAALGACAAPPDPYQRYLPALEHLDASGPDWISSRPVLLVADCQLHNNYQKPIPDRNLSIKQFAGTAIRPPQLDLFAPDVLRWILKHGGTGTEAILHLGDAIDLACEGEFREFLEVMQCTDKPWLMVPGNHECFYFGSYDPRYPEMWEDACYGAGSPIQKDHYIRLYVAAILGQDDPGTLALADALGLREVRKQDPFALQKRIPDRFHWEAPDGTGGFLIAIAWNIDSTRPWRSFILQRADLTGRGERSIPFHAILMDTCQYAELPAMVPNAWDNYPLELNCGLTGEMLADQLRIIRKWVEARKENLLTFVVHHPLDQLASKSRSSLLWLWRHSRTGGAISGHTHEGHYYYHELGDGRVALELNVASTSDWPMEWRTLVAHFNGADFYIKSKRHTMVEELKNRKGYFLREWEVAQGANDDFRKYMIGEPSPFTFTDYLLAYHLWPRVLGRLRVRPSEAACHTEARIKDTMLWAFHRLIRMFPTDTKAGKPRWPEGCRTDAQVKERIEILSKKEPPIEETIAFLKELVAFEKSRSTRDPETRQSTDESRVRYKLSQAVWASRYEVTHGRRLQARDELIRVEVKPKRPE